MIKVCEMIFSISTKIEYIKMLNCSLDNDSVVGGVEEEEEWVLKFVTTLTPHVAPRGELTVSEYLEVLNHDKNIMKQIRAIEKAIKNVVIPLWLQSSEVYEESLKMGMEISLGSFTENSRFIRENSDIDSFSDFEDVMVCIDYWGVRVWPDSVYTFIMLNTADVLQWCEASAMSVAQSLDLNDQLLLGMKAENNFMNKVCEVGSIGWLTFGWSEKCGHIANRINDLL